MFVNKRIIGSFTFPSWKKQGRPCNNPTKLDLLEKNLIFEQNFYKSSETKQNYKSSVEKLYSRFLKLRFVGGRLFGTFFKMDEKKHRLLNI